MRVFERYVPEEAHPGIQYLRDGDGVDWYDAQDEYEGVALVVCTDASGRVCAADPDSTRLYPIGMAVWALDAADIPEGFSVAGDWAIEAGKLAPRRQTEQDIEGRMRALLAPALQDYQALQVMVDVGVATGEEVARHEALRDYCQALYRVDQQEGYPADVVWPETP